MSDYSQALASLYNQLQNMGGNANLTNMPQPTQNELRNQGWYSENPVAMYPMTMGNSYDNATRTANFTPIMRDNQGNYAGMMDDVALEKYAEGVLKNQHPDYMNMQMGKTYDNDRQGAWDEAARINNLQTAYNAISQMANRK